MQMSASISLETLLSIASFSIALGGLIVGVFFSAGPKKGDPQKRMVLLLAVLFLVILLTGVVLYRVYQHGRPIDSISAQIMGIISNDRKTAFQVQESLSGVFSYTEVSEALDQLVQKTLIRPVIIELHDQSGEMYRVQAFWVRSFDVN